MADQERNSERNIFAFFNGARLVYGDPLQIHRELLTELGDIDAVLSDVGSEDMTRCLPALAHLMPAVRKVFAMAPFDPETGAGATESHCRDALTAFLDFLDAKKKSIGS